MSTVKSTVNTRKKINHAAGITARVLESVQSAADDARTVVLSGQGINEREFAEDIRAQVAKLESMLKMIDKILEG